MFKYAVLLLSAFCGVLAATAGDGGAQTLQIITPGLDTIPPAVSVVSNNCGVVELNATELRNFPDPPSMDPSSKDQVDRGIASISLATTPPSLNARLTLITDQVFPSDPSYKEFTFRVEPIDKSKRTVAFVLVRDFAGNVFSREVIIDPPIPSTSTDAVSQSVRVDRVDSETVTLTNSTGTPQTITSIRVEGSGRFVITSGGTSGAVTLSPGESRTVTVEYRPTLASENGDQATLIVETACGAKNVALSGIGLVGRVTTEDWQNVVTTINSKICKQGGFEVENRGSAAVTITGFVSNNPNVSIVSGINAANPYVLNPGETVSVIELCYERSTVGTDNAIVTVQVDADDGDVECVVTAEARNTVSVAEEERTRMNLRYVAATGTIEFNDHRACTVVDVQGRAIASALEGAQRVTLPSTAQGVVFVVFNADPSVAIPVLITR